MGINCTISFAVFREMPQFITRSETRASQNTLTSKCRRNKYLIWTILTQGTKTMIGYMCIKILSARRFTVHKWNTMRHDCDVFSRSTKKHCKICPGTRVINFCHCHFPEKSSRNDKERKNITRSKSLLAFFGPKIGKTGMSDFSKFSDRSDQENLRSDCQKSSRLILGSRGKLPPLISFSLIYNLLWSLIVAAKRWVCVQGT